MSTDRLFDVSGQVVLVAGGAGGLGAALSRGFAQRGARCAIADIDEGQAREMVRALPGDGHTAHWLDVTSSEACAHAVDSVLDRHKRLDTLLNCSGRLVIARAESLDVETFAEVLTLNTVGAYAIARAAARTMRETGTSGRIITLSSVSSLVANPGYAAYATSKGALVQMTRVLAREWAEYGITVNALAPAMTETPMTREHLGNEEFRDQALQAIPMGRVGTPEDILACAILLASAGGSFLTGQTLYVDGGRTLT